MTKWKKLCGRQKLAWQNGSNPNFRLPLSLISASVSSFSIPCNVIRLKLSLQTLKSFEEFWNEFEMGSCNLSSKTEPQNLKSFDRSLKWVLAISDQNLTANSEEFWNKFEMGYSNPRSKPKCKLWKSFDTSWKWFQESLSLSLLCKNLPIQRRIKFRYS